MTVKSEKISRPQGRHVALEIERAVDLLAGVVPERMGHGATAVVPYRPGPSPQVFFRCKILEFPSDVAPV